MKKYFAIKKILLSICFFILAMTSALSQVDSSYVIKKGDVLEINVMEHPEFSMVAILVMPDGYVQFPGLGSIPAAGSTINSFTKLMLANVSKYVVNPILTVFVKSMPTQVVNVVGYVTKAGQIQVFEPIDLITALSKAGGIENVRKCKWITIIRANQSFEKIRVSTLFSKNNKDQLPKIYVGDTVYVLEPNEFNWSKLTFFTSTTYLVLQIYSFFVK